MSNYNSWSPLKEVWLGDCYPKHFYDHLDNEIKDLIQDFVVVTANSFGVEFYDVYVQWG